MKGRAGAKIRLVGIVFICTGIVLYGTQSLWFSTRTDLPVNIPISMAVGHVRTPSFKVNRNAIYLIHIEVQKTISSEILNCLLGVASNPTEAQQCQGEPSVVHISWVLSSEGETVARGSTDKDSGGAWTAHSILRTLGSFQSEKGRDYVLDADVLADGSVLQAANPRLKVEVSPAVYETEIAQSTILFFSMSVLVLFGAILLLVSFIKSRRARSLLLAPTSEE